LDRIEFVVEKIMRTAVGELEFYAVLRRLPRDLATEDRAAALAAGFPRSGLDGDAINRSDQPADFANTAQAQLPTDVLSLSAREQRLLHAKRALMARIRALESRMRGRGRGST
jgi:hypothetical protein